MARSINNVEDTIDSRDVIDRIDELEDEQQAHQDEIENLEEEISDAFDDVTNAEDEDDRKEALSRLSSAKDDLATAVNEFDAWESEEGGELDELRALANEAEGYASDWNHGETLIRDSYFIEYAQRMAEECGLCPDNTDTNWPINHIDWDAAADQLKNDYKVVEFDGVDYWIH